MKLEIINGKYEYRKRKLLVFDKLNVTFETGKFYLITGESGSGKSTLLRILGILDPLTEGTLKIGDRDVKQLSNREKAQLRLHHLGFVFQKFYLDPDLTAYENILLPMLIQSNLTKQEKKKRAEQLLCQFGLKDRRKHYPKELSGGEQQRVAIARAMANQPSFLLADEPTGNLDAKNERQILECFQQLVQEGIGVIMVSHSDHVRSYADQIYTLKAGELK